jgi:hypothetical protein
MVGRTTSPESGADSPVEAEADDISDDERTLPWKFSRDTFDDA